MSKIDVDELREYMTDYCGTAMFGGLSAAALDLSDMDQMSGEELCRKAEELNVDLRDFEVYVWRHFMRPKPEVALHL